VRRPSAAAIERELAPLVAAPAVFTDVHGQYGPTAAFAGRHGAPYHDSRLDHRPRATLLAGVHAVKDFLQRLRLWLRRFRGVATRYLMNYLRWHVYWDRSVTLSLNFTLLHWHDRVELTRLPVRTCTESDRQPITNSSREQSPSPPRPHIGRRRQQTPPISGTPPDP
jgi:hypothetical protein